MLVTFLRKLDDENKNMHFVLGMNCYNERAYFTSWYENKNALMAESNDTLTRSISSFWFNPNANTICIELR